MKNKTEIRNAKLLFVAALLIGFALRLYGLGTIPGGLNQDEASAGYEAFSLLKYGIDRNGISNPVHLLAWGSGQNIAYTWLCMPFVAVMGLSVTAVRLPMAVVGCVSIVAFAVLVKEVWNERYALWAAVYFAVFPWHIMKSRWALESNLFPDLMLWGSVLLVLFIKRQKSSYLYLAVTVLSFSVYSYGTAYMFMPLFMGMLWLYMLIRKKISAKQFVMSAVLCVVLVMPIMLFALINIYDLPQFSFMGFTVPKMYQQRFSTVMRTGDNFMAGCITNLKEFIEILVNQGDGLPWNSMEKYGICYRLFIPLIPVGAAVSFFSRKTENAVMNIWFICSILVIAVTDVNVNRANIVFIPLAYYISLAIAFIADRHRLLKPAMLCVTACLCTLFCTTYFTQWAENIKHPFFYSYDKALETALQADTDRIYISTGINQPYMLTMFYTEADPHIYIETAEKIYQYSAFESVKSFDKYFFYMPETVDLSAAYIVDRYMS
ncbi:MAG: glycosyltransferase family 39 protein, partial [Oscillospiraceae bacterium]|nr:glycosyltransferase family 39 protein [Oscillospiraceae bacterium]